MFQLVAFYQKALEEPSLMSFRQWVVENMVVEVKDGMNTIKVLLDPGMVGRILERNASTLFGNEPERIEERTEDWIDKDSHPRDSLIVNPEALAGDVPEPAASMHDANVVQSLDSMHGRLNEVGNLIGRVDMEKVYVIRKQSLELILKTAEDLKGRIEQVKGKYSKASKEMKQSEKDIQALVKDTTECVNYAREQMKNLPMKE